MASNRLIPCKNAVGDKITGKTSGDGQITGTFDGHTLKFEITYSAKSVYPRPISRRTGTLQFKSDMVGSNVPDVLTGPYVDFKPDGTGSVDNLTPV